MESVKREYESVFACRFSMLQPNGTLLLKTADGKAYNLDNDGSIPWEKLWAKLEKLMKESLDTGKNVVLEEYKGYEYKIESLKPNCDY